MKIRIAQSLSHSFLSILRSLQIAIMQSFSFLTLFATGSLATKLLLPLYHYPEGTAWDGVYSTIEANPQLDFQFILNVDSGPGGSEPNSDFVTGTSKLNSYSNVMTLGYVHCSYGQASQDDVNRNTSNWAAWNSYTGAKVSIDGIFFDETPNFEGSAGDNDVAFMSAVVEAAASAFGSHVYTGMFNPGATVLHEEFWGLADYIVVFENSASAYSSSVLTTNVAAGKANQSSILIPDFASVGTAEQAQTWLQEMVTAGIGSSSIINSGYTDSASTSEPAGLVLVAAALAGSSSSTLSSTGSNVAASLGEIGAAASSTFITKTTPTATAIASSGTEDSSDAAESTDDEDSADASSSPTATASQTEAAPCQTSTTRPRPRPRPRPCKLHQRRHGRPHCVGS